MPRLTNTTYLFHHHQLKGLWATDERWFRYLSPNGQWALHRFYQPASDLTDTELIVHRRAVTAAEPFLPQRAGRAYARFSRGEAAPAGAATVNGRTVYVWAVMRPEPDLRLLRKGSDCHRQKGD